MNVKEGYYSAELGELEKRVIEAEYSVDGLSEECNLNDFFCFKKHTTPYNNPYNHRNGCPLEKRVIEAEYSVDGLSEELYNRYMDQLEKEGLNIS